MHPLLDSIRDFFLGFLRSHYTLTTSFNCPSSACGPYLLPAHCKKTTPFPLVLHIPNVAGKDAAPGQCEIPVGQNVAFSLKWKSDDFRIIAQVTVDQNLVFSDKPSARAMLKQSFAAFCEALEAMEARASPQGLLPGSTHIIANRIAASLPLRLNELLYFYYGFDSERRCIDLHPGMRLSIETGAYQFVAPRSAPGSADNAFVARGQAFYYISHDKDQKLSFNAYLDGLSPYQVCPSGSPVAGVLDLAATCSGGPSPSTYARRYYRLIYPNQFSNPGTISSQPQISQNVTLLGANSLAELNKATEIYVSSKTCPASSQHATVCLYFSGRVSIVPEIPIMIAHKTHYVPIGTTLQDLLNTLFSIPPDGLIDLFRRERVEFKRYALNALRPDARFKQSKVAFKERTRDIPVGDSTERVMTQFDIPLIQGDSIDVDTHHHYRHYRVTTRSLTNPHSETVVGPYLLPHDFYRNRHHDTLTLKIFNVATTTSPSGDIPAGANPDFSLKWFTDHFDRTHARVIVQTKNLYTDDPTARVRFKQAFAALRQALETLEVKNHCLIPNGATLIAKQIAGSLPLRFDELLHYYYNFDQDARYIDLHAGMRLMVEISAYQFVAPTSMPGSGLNGFVPQAAIAYDVLLDERYRLTFSPYIRAMQPFQITEANEQVANLIDLAQADSARRHYRLIYPAVMSNSTQIPPATAQNVTLLGADTLVDLEEATTAYLQRRPMPSTQPPIVYRYFTGRASVIPHMRISVQKELIYVPVGTTLRAILDRYTVLAKDEFHRFFSRIFHPLLRRYSIPLSSHEESKPLAAHAIRFEHTTPYVPLPNSNQTVTQWDIPLVMGDVISWQQDM